MGELAIGRVPPLVLPEPEGNAPDSVGVKAKDFLSVGLLGHGPEVTNLPPSDNPGLLQGFAASRIQKRRILRKRFQLISGPAPDEGVLKRTLAGGCDFLRFCPKGDTQTPGSRGKSQEGGVLSQGAGQGEDHGCGAWGRRGRNSLWLGTRRISPLGSSA